MSEWISVEDKMPKSCKIVLAITDAYKDENAKYLVTCYWKEAKRWYDIVDYVTTSRRRESHKITHWMELPKLPEEK